jgi:hypothetical protein
MMFTPASKLRGIVDEVLGDLLAMAAADAEPTRQQCAKLAQKISKRLKAPEKGDSDPNWPK